MQLTSVPQPFHQVDGWRMLAVNLDGAVRLGAVIEADVADGAPGARQAIQLLVGHHRPTLTDAAPPEFDGAEPHGALLGCKNTFRPVFRSRRRTPAPGA